jgi:aryl-alcohol dehydrogenase-like predicted oxidoreductase
MPRSRCSPAQLLHSTSREELCLLLAIAWVLARGPDIVPIVGRKRIKYLQEDLAALWENLGFNEYSAFENDLRTSVY